VTAPDADWPADPIAAVTDPDPWPYYAWLATQPMHRDDRLGAWVAGRPADALEVLTHPDARVRPASAPVPPHLVGTEAGAAFARLPRMTDGPEHGPRRAVVEGAIEGWTPTVVADACAAAADAIDGDLDRWLTAFPTAVVRHLLGAQLEVDDAVGLAGALAAAFGPGGGPADAPAASAAAQRLSPLEVAVLFQAFDATAGLVGAAISGGDRTAVHNTRRFMASDADVAGCRVSAGDTVVVVLAAAALPFGAGLHRCPAADLAAAIAHSAAAHVGHDHVPVGCRHSLNVRIPIFGEG
jgi:cytochrome P450